MKIEVIYLAAGFGSRFGSNKLLYELKGKALYRYGLDMLLSVLEDTADICSVTVVTQYDEIEAYVMQQRKLHSGMVRCVRNPHSERGISSSIQIGLLAGDASLADAYLFYVADEPYLKKETLLQMLSAYKNGTKGILCMKSGTDRSNPVLFGRKYRRELLALSGDAGGKQIIARFREDVGEFFVADKEELIDIDYNTQRGVNG